VLFFGRSFVHLELFPTPELSLRHFEERAARLGYQRVAGIDEAGRGPLAGPVVAAAVILPQAFELPGLNDSKLIPEKERVRLFRLIRSQALAVGVGIVPAPRIDESNILQGTLQAMVLAVQRLKITPDFLLIDGITPVPVPIPQQTLKKGDSRSCSIAAASIVAKVVRDRMMAGYDRQYPGYGFAAHKGYGSSHHQQVIAQLGPCALHRRSFSGVREYCPVCAKDTEEE
jgi:ribonuclease HII